jgi:hypothetical protein
VSLLQQSTKIPTIVWIMWKPHLAIELKNKNETKKILENDSFISAKKLSLFTTQTTKKWESTHIHFESKLIDMENNGKEIKQNETKKKFIFYM